MFSSAETVITKISPFSGVELKVREGLAYEKPDRPFRDQKVNMSMVEKQRMNEKFGGDGLL